MAERHDCAAAVAFEVFDYHLAAGNDGCRGGDADNSLCAGVADTNVPWQRTAVPGIAVDDDPQLRRGRMVRVSQRVL